MLSRHHCVVNKMAKRKAQNSTTEEENDDDAHKRPKIKRTRSSKNIHTSESQMEVSVNPEDSNLTRVGGDDDDSGNRGNCSQMPDFAVQVGYRLSIPEIKIA